MPILWISVPENKDIHAMFAGKANTLCRHGVVGKKVISLYDFTTGNKCSDCLNAVKNIYRGPDWNSDAARKASKGS
jgi:hypothetical protein